MASSALATAMSASAATTPASARACAARAVSRSWVDEMPCLLSRSARLKDDLLFHKRGLGVGEPRLGSGN